MDISILIPALNEAENLRALLPAIKLNLEELTPNYEIIIIDGGSCDDTRNVASQFGAKFITQIGQGFGFALRQGFEIARGKYIITIDADLSHEPKFIKEMWKRRHDAELIIASRYVKGGSAQMGLARCILSRMLNASFSFLLSLKIKDLSSNFRMYKKEVLDSFQTSGRNFDIIEEILLKVYCKGWQILEVPFNYQPRRYGRSHIKLIQLARDYLKTLLRMWYLRNSIYSADYDYRAFYSRIFLQRFWQRKRYDIILNFLDKKNIFLDVGCGSSKIISDNPDAIALDLSLDKLRYLRTQNNRLVNANADNLPFKDVSFDCVVCSQVIEHVANPNIFRQMHRVLRKNGLLIIGTPDYGKLAWRVIECLYSVIHKGGYADQHITHYTHKSLKNILETVGFDILDYAYICNAELVIKAKKI